MRLCLFEHCSLCFRVRMAAALKRLHLQETVVLDDDSETMIKLVGKRVIPILVKNDGAAMLESMDMVAHIDSVGPPILVGPQRAELAIWASNAADKTALLTWPAQTDLRLRWYWAPLGDSLACLPLRGRLGQDYAVHLWDAADGRLVQRWSFLGLGPPGQLQPTQGQVLLNDRPLYENLDLLKGYISYIPQEDAFDEHLTIGENLEFAAAIRAPHLSGRDLSRRLEGKLIGAGNDAEETASLIA